MTQSLEEIKKRYELEKSLADKLKKADKKERPALYSSVYNELFTGIPSLRAVVQKNTPEKWNKPSPQLKWLKPFLTSETVFMDIGAGNCKLSLETSKIVRQVYAIEASSNISHHPAYPANFKLIVVDACTIGVPENTVNIAYSRHVIEHLHPDDTIEHLRNVYKTVAPGGIYICITPNRIFGPHDGSKNFDRIAAGMHLKEYSHAELHNLLRKTGFNKVRMYFKLMGIFMILPVFPMKWCEFLVSGLPYTLRILLGKSSLFKPMLNIRLIAYK
ncbi:MAG: methyltransferase domain-containing protein [Planctomycetota bacterium]